MDIAGSRRSRHPSRRGPHPAARALTGLGLVALAAGLVLFGVPSCSTDSSSPSCTCTPTACATCSATCQLTPKLAGTVLPDPTAGDCHKLVCDGAGSTMAAIDDTDLPVDANPCTTDLCAAGAPSHGFENAGVGCGGTKKCDGAGACVDCLAPADCGTDTACTTFTCSASGSCGTSFVPAGTASTCGPGMACDGAGSCAPFCVVPADCPGADTECHTRTCTSGICGADNALAGTPLAGQVGGDCRVNQCDGNGNAVSAPDDADLPVDGNPCTQDRCNAGTPSNPFEPAETICPTGFCDGAGACFACVSGGDCPSGVCAGHVCQAPSCTDLVANGSETDVDCGGPDCPKCADDLHCLGDGDCASGMCYGASCRAALNGCTPGTALDRTANATTVVSFPGAGFAYAPPCIKVRAGSVVTFTAAAGNSFLFHPLLGGLVASGVATPATTGPFVPVTNSGTTKDFTMSATGSYPYYCTSHGPLFGMEGAVFVVP